MFEGEHFLCSSKARLDLIDDKNDIVLRADLLQFLQVAVRRNDESPLKGFDVYDPDRFSGRVEIKKSFGDEIGPIEVAGRVCLPAGTTVTIGARHPVPLGHEGAESELAVFHFSVQAHGHGGFAMEGNFEAQNSRTAGKEVSLSSPHVEVCLSCP